MANRKKYFFEEKFAEDGRFVQQNLTREDANKQRMAAFQYAKKIGKKLVSHVRRSGDMYELELMLFEH